MTVRMTARRNDVQETADIEEELKWKLSYDEHPKWWMNTKERIRHTATVRMLKNRLATCVDSEYLK